MNRSVRLLFTGTRHVLRGLRGIISETGALFALAVLEKGFQVPGPLFLVGCGHSGTSATLRVLAKAPKLHAIENESRLFLFRRPGVLREFLFLVSKRGFSKLRDASFQARKQGGVWVEKTPRHIHFIDRIKFWIPNSRFIAVWRDPLDVIPSLMARGIGLEEALGRWVEDNSELIQMTRQGRRILVIRFEDLIEFPERTVEVVNAYIGLSADSGVPVPGIQAAPEHLPSREKHAARRTAQMAVGLFDSRGSSARTLSSATAIYIRKRTDSLVAELGTLQTLDWS